MRCVGDGYCWNYVALASIHGSASVNFEGKIQYGSEELLKMREGVGNTLRLQTHWLVPEQLVSWNLAIQNLVNGLPKNHDDRYATDFEALRALCVRYNRHGLVVVHDTRDSSAHMLPPNCVFFMSRNALEQPQQFYDDGFEHYNVESWKHDDFLRLKYPSLSDDDKANMIVFVFNGYNHYDGGFPLSFATTPMTSLGASRTTKRPNHRNDYADTNDVCIPSKVQDIAYLNKRRAYDRTVYRVRREDGPLINKRNEKQRQYNKNSRQAETHEEREKRLASMRERKREKRKPPQYEGDDVKEDGIDGPNAASRDVQRFVKTFEGLVDMVQCKASLTSILCK